MVYPRSPKDEDPNSGLDSPVAKIKPPVRVTDPGLMSPPQVPGARGGAPRLTGNHDVEQRTVDALNDHTQRLQDQQKQEWQARRDSVRTGEGRTTPQLVTDPPLTGRPREFWKSSPMNEQPTDLVRHAAAPWKPEELDQKWGPLVQEMERKLWNHYSNLAPEQQARAHWQQVGINAQQAARSLVTRMLVNGAGVERPQLDQFLRGRLGKMDLRQWLAALPTRPFNRGGGA